jgi:hypothetical protein
MTMVFENDEEQSYVVDDFRYLVDESVKLGMPIGDTRVLRHFFMLAKTGLSTRELVGREQRMLEETGNG